MTEKTISENILASQKMKFLNSDIGEGEYPYIVAEISCNHAHHYGMAKRLIHAAKEAGADACKIQIYTPEEMTIDWYTDDFLCKSGPWKGKKLWDLYTKAQTDYKLAEYMFKCANDIHMPIFASVFGDKGLQFAEELDCQAYKIASFECMYLDLIEKVVATGKPLVLSTGMATYSQLDLSLSKVDLNNTVLMHCVSAYPTPIVETNLGRINKLSHLWPECVVGFSDHTLGIEVGPLAVVRGAKMLEKHLMLDDIPTEDAAFSLYPYEFKRYTTLCRRAAEACVHRASELEQQAKQYSRSMYAIDDIMEGEVFTTRNIAMIRPGYGVKCYQMKDLIGKKALKGIMKGTPIKEEHFHDFP